MALAQHDGPAPLVDVREIAGRGRGLVALQPLKRGMRIFDETALLSLPTDLFAAPNGLAQAGAMIGSALKALPKPSQAAFLCLSNCFVGASRPPLPTLLGTFCALSLISSELMWQARMPSRPLPARRPSSRRSPARTIRARPTPSSAGTSRPRCSVCICSPTSSPAQRSSSRTSIPGNLARIVAHCSALSTDSAALAQCVPMTRRTGDGRRSASSGPSSPVGHRDGSPASARSSSRRKCSMSTISSTIGHSALRGL